jgi:branched-chain amino acid transport system substrate-binding protein
MKETVMPERRQLLLAAGLLPLTLHRHAAAQAAAAPIRIGQSAPLTGTHSVLGLAYKAAALAVFKEANAAPGGVNGRRIELVSLDDQDQPERTAINAKLLASEHQVSALFGFVGAGADRVGARAAAEEGLPYIAPMSGSVELRTPQSPRTYTFRASHADEVRYIVRHTETIGVTRLAMVYEYNFLGWELRDTLLDTLSAKQQATTAFTSIDREGSEYSIPGAVAIVMARQPEAIILGSNYVATAKFVRAVREAGFKGYFYTLSTVGSQGLVASLGSLVSGISVTQVVPFPLSDVSPASRQHRAFCERHGLQPSFHSMEAWLSASMLVDAFKRAKAFSPTGISEALDAAPARDFGGFVGQWRSSKPNPKAFVSITVYTRDGKLIT